MENDAATKAVNYLFADGGKGPAARIGSFVKVHGGASLSSKPPGVSGKGGTTSSCGTAKERDRAKRRVDDKALSHSGIVGDSRLMNPQTGIGAGRREGVGACVRFESHRADVDVDNQYPSDRGMTKRRHIVHAVRNSGRHPIIR